MIEGYKEHELSKSEIFFYMGDTETRLYVLENLGHKEYVKAKVISSSKDVKELTDYITELRGIGLNINGEYNYEIKEDSAHKILIIYRN